MANDQMSVYVSLSPLNDSEIAQLQEAMVVQDQTLFWHVLYSHVIITTTPRQNVLRQWPPRYEVK